VLAWTTIPPTVLQSDHLANLRKEAQPLFNFGRTREFERLLMSPVREGQSGFRQLKSVSPGLVERLVAEYRAGASVYELQERHGVHRNTIAKHLRDHGLRLGRQPLSTAEVHRACELHAEGLSLNAIGRKMGRDPKTVKTALVESQEHDS
jgi:DNA-binding CsgD family transcriptional regulator